MVTADVQIVGQGSVVVAPVWTHGGLTAYKMTATPAAGWTFDRYEWDSVVRIVQTSGREITETTHYTSRENPYDHGADEAELVDGVQTFPGYETWYETIENATAYFVQSHGQGIIYDPNQQNGIIYDLTTGLPMCYT